jgi:Carboxypeptidase regulatory-like domain
MKTPRCIAMTLIVFPFVLLSSVFGQSDRGAINGTVTDGKGAAVPNALITITNMNTSEKRETKTTSEGNFTISELKADPYSLTVQATGFKSSTIDNLQVAVQVTRRVDVKLEVGEVSETVTVSAADTIALQTENSVQQRNVTERQVRELPLVVAAESGGRTPLAFIYLDSSITPTNDGGGSGGTNATNFRVNGSQGLGTDILIDGVATRRGENGSFFSEVAPGPNAFQEFTISTNNYSAEFGNSTGGVVNFTIKTGSNNLHGEGYLFLINEALNANIARNRILDIARPVDRQQDFGFSVGGPVRLPKKVFGPLGYDGRNRTFFFFNYGGYRTSRTETVDITVPTVKMRQGDFSELLTDPYVLPYFGGPVQIFDPRGVPGERTAIPGNRLDLYQGGALISPIGRNFINLFPLPNQPGLVGGTVHRNYRAASGTTAVTDYYVTKVTQNISDRQTVNVSYTYRKLPSDKGGFPRFPEPFVAQGRWDQTFRSYYARLQHDYTFTPRLFNHINLGWNRTAVENHNFGRGEGRATALGLRRGSTQDLGFPLIGFPNYGNDVTSLDPRSYQAGGSTSFDNDTNDNTAQFSDFLSYTSGRHTFKFGGDARVQQLNVRGNFDLGGNFNFMGRQTANARADTTSAGAAEGWPIASLLAGAPEFSFNSLQTAQPSWKYIFAAGFIQDDIKVTPKLTLNLGIRYDYSKPRTERFDRYLGFDPNVANPAAGGRRGALVSAPGQGGLEAINEGLVNTDKTNWGPRLGFAYLINDKTVVRGGFGVYYAPLFYNANGNDGLAGYNPGSVNINPDLNALNAVDERGNPRTPISLDNYPALPVTGPNLQFVGILDRTVDYYDLNYKLGRTAHYNLDLQRLLPYNFMVSVSYIGNRGTRLRSSLVPLNATPIEALRLGNALLRKRLADVTEADRAYAASVGFPLPASPDDVYPGFGNQPALTSSFLAGTVAQALRPYPQYGGINNRLESQGQSWYNAVKIDLQRRFAGGVQFGASYTFSKFLTDAAEDLYGGSPITGVLQNPRDRRSLRSIAPGSYPHSFVVYYLAELPFGKGKRYLDRGGLVDRLVGGWQISGVQRYRSSQAVAPFVPGGQREFLDLVGIGGNLRPNLTGQPFYTGNDAVGLDFRYLNPAAFTPPPDYRAVPQVPDPNNPGQTIPAPIGSPEYRAFYADPFRFLGTAAPTYDNLRVRSFFGEDISIMKKTRITETTALEIRAEFFNLFNRSRFAGPNADVTNRGDYGVVGRFADILQPRRIQLGARFIF